MTDGWKNIAGAHSLPFLVDFSVCEFGSFASLDGSKHSVCVWVTCSVTTIGQGGQSPPRFSGLNLMLMVGRGFSSKISPLRVGSCPPSAFQILVMPLVTLPACCITWLSRNKFFTRRKERKKTILCFWRWAVSNSGNTTASVNNRNSIGSAQEYMISVCVRELNCLWRLIT